MSCVDIIVLRIYPAQVCVCVCVFLFCLFFSSGPISQFAVQFVTVTSFTDIVHYIKTQSDTDLVFHTNIAPDDSILKTRIVRILFHSGR